MQASSETKRLGLLESLLTKQYRLQKIDTSFEVDDKHLLPVIANNLRHFARAVPVCDIVHCNLSKPEEWTMLALSHVLIARFFGKTVVTDLGFSFDEESFDHPPLALRMILGLSTITVVTSEHAATLLARRGINAVQIPEALTSTEFTDRKVTSVQPQILTVYQHYDHGAAECVVKAFRFVKAKYPRAEMKILVDNQDLNACRQLTGESEHSSITVAAADNTTETASCYAEADMFVNSSVVGGLRPIKRAMASGLPVVSAAGFYRDELIIDRRNGLAFRENNQGDLADRIIELIETPEMIPKLTDQARLSVADHTWSKISQLWLACYRKFRLSQHRSNVARASHPSHQPTHI
jgi:glycosyltransferase involved in cell wall biosynthesis